MLMTNVPSSSLTVTDWYKQDIYDRSDAKIGYVKDVLVGPNGQINAVIVGVGGFLAPGRRMRGQFRFIRNHKGPRLPYDGYDQDASGALQGSGRQHQD